jgi:hypothetical protein
MKLCSDNLDALINGETPSSKILSTSPLVMDASI